MTFSSSSSQYFILPSDDLERSSLQSKPAKTTKKSNYGSLRQDTQQTQQTAKTFIVNYDHKIMPGDTLLGISLKYNIPIENIKRANRLWSNDLTFLKETLIIPLDKEKLKAMNLEAITENRGHSKSSDQVCGQDSTSTSGMEKAEHIDFLNKFDSFINESKMKLKTLETQNSNQAISDYLNNTANKYNQNSDNNNNSFREDDLFYRDETLFKDVSTSSGKSKTESGSISSTSSSNLSSVLQRSSNSNLTSNGGHGNSNSDVFDHQTNTTASSKFSNYYGSNHNLISSTDSSSDRAKLARENLQRLEREKDNLYEL